MNDNKIKFRFKIKLSSCLLVGILFLAPAAVFAKTLNDYRADVKTSKVAIENLLNFDTKDTADGEFIKLKRKTVKQIRAAIPPSQTIEWQNSSVEADNQWLVEKLDQFERTAPDKPARRDILTEIGERLAALERKLDELEKPFAANRTKDEDKQKLAEILRREEYQKPSEKQESLFEKIWRRVLDWLADFFPKPNISPSVANGFQSLSFVLQMILYVLIFGIIGFLIYRFAPLFAKRFRGSEAKAKKERVILGERLAADETAQNLFAEAENLARQGNLRGAIRKGYIALLCELSDRKIIGLSQHKTNRDYLRDVRKKTELYQNMSGLTANFERHWYGLETAHEIDWENFKSDYQRAVKSQ